MLLLALFIGVPLIEIALFVQLGSVMDLGWILLIVVLTAILGTWLVRKQGQGVLRQIQSSFETLNDPTEPLAHGAMILFSGALLLTPGFFTDTIGFLLLIPAFRMAAFRWVKSRVVVHQAGMGPGHAHSASYPNRDSRSGASDGVIDGEYADVTASEPRGELREKSGKHPPSGWTQHKS